MPVRLSKSDDYKINQAGGHCISESILSGGATNTVRYKKQKAIEEARRLVEIGEAQVVASRLV